MLVIIFLIVLLLAGLFLATRAWPLKARAGESLSTGADSLLNGSETFTVGTYNIHRAKGVDGQKDLSRIAAVIRDCDIVALQEVEGTRIFRWRDQAKLLSTIRQRVGHFTPTRKLLFFPQRGNALVSTYSVKNWWTTPLFPSTGRAHRNFSVYQFCSSEGSFHILNTHLSKPSEGERPLEAVMEAFKRYPRAILMGDFNAAMSHPAMTRLIPGDAVDALSSIESDMRRVDMILVRGLDVEKAWSTPVGPSDHPFFAARIRFNHPEN